MRKSDRTSAPRKECGIGERYFYTRREQRPMYRKTTLRYDIRFFFFFYSFSLVDTERTEAGLDFANDLVLGLGSDFSVVPELFLNLLDR